MVHSWLACLEVQSCHNPVTIFGRPHAMGGQIVLILCQCVHLLSFPERFKNFKMVEQYNTSLRFVLSLKCASFLFLNFPGHGLLFCD